MKKSVLLFMTWLLVSVIAFAQSPTYIIDFEADMPEVKYISPQVTEVIGNVLDFETKESVGFGYKITMTVSGGPASLEDTPINFAYTNSDGPVTTHVLNAAPSIFQEKNTRIGMASEGYFQTLLTYSLQGWIQDDENLEFTYYRDPSTKMRFELELDNGEDLVNVSYQLGDMDFNLVGTNGTSVACPQGEGTDLENYTCRDSYIDQITFISGVGSNEYTYDDSKITQKDNVFYSKFLDANDDQLVDEQTDGRISYSETDGNITVYNEGNIGKKIIFEYDDPGFPLEAEQNNATNNRSNSSSRSSEYHDFDAGNQVMYFLSGMTFSAEQCQMITTSATEGDIYQGEEFCITIEGPAPYEFSPATDVTLRGTQVCFSPLETTTYTITSSERNCDYSAQVEVRIWNEASIPTMSEWGLMIFGLLVINLGVFFLYRQEEIVVLTSKS